MKCHIILFSLFSTVSSFAATYYVDASRPNDSGAATNWATAKKTIQSSVDLTSNGDTVLVTNGVYDLGGAVAPIRNLTNRVCITTAITVQSVNGRDVTIIQGSAGSNGGVDLNATRGVYMQSGCTLIGFTVTNGFTMPVGSGSGAVDDSGGGIYLRTGCVVSNCNILGNFTGSCGGGLYISGGTISDCCVKNNTAANYGGGLCNFDSCAVINCDFSGNSGKYGGGASLNNGGSMTCCSLSHNGARYGGGVYLNYGGTLNSCVLSENAAIMDSGGADLDHGGTLNNCTVTKNSAGIYGGGSRLVLGGEINNCIVYGNSGPYGKDISAYGTDHIIRNTCASDGVTSGVNGCKTSNPLFVDSGNNDFRLLSASPCINAGNNTYITSNMDILGNIRVVDGTVDMGAYECQAGLPSYLITTTPGLNGTISPHNPTVLEGDDISFSIQPDTGYRIGSLFVNNVSAQIQSIITLTNVQSPYAISATFVVDSHELTVVNGSGSGSYAFSSEIQIHAYELTGVTFSEWTVTPAEYSNQLEDPLSATTTFTMPLTNITLTANYLLLTAYADATRPDDSGIGNSWLNAKKTIQAAVDSVAPGGLVLVTNGVYSTGSTTTPNYSQMNRVCITKPVTVQSINGPEVTIIKGSKGADDTDAVRGVFITDGCSLHGFTITDCSTMNNSEADYYYDLSGGGIWMTTNCLVSDCIVSNNNSRATGGGVLLYDGGLMKNSLISGNSSDTLAGGASIYVNGSINNCVISDNIVRFDGGGVEMFYGGDLNSCVIVGNAARYGGGIYMFGFSPNTGQINNCTVTENGSNSGCGGGGIYASGGAQIYNSIIWNNTAVNTGHNLSIQGASSIHYSCSPDGILHGANGCTTNNPKFIAPKNANYQLAFDSPCINAGHNSRALTASDVDERNRIVGGVVDMGAHEYQGASDDVDNDGIPDLWEMNHFNSPRAQVPSAIA